MTFSTYSLPHILAYTHTQSHNHIIGVCLFVYGFCLDLVYPRVELNSHEFFISFPSFFYSLTFFLFLFGFTSVPIQCININKIHRGKARLFVYMCFAEKSATTLMWIVKLSLLFWEGSDKTKFFEQEFSMVFFLINSEQIMSSTFVAPIIFMKLDHVQM